MADNLTQVLNAARQLTADVEIYQNKDLKIRRYGEDKVRIYIVLPGDLPDVLIAGDAKDSDSEDAKKALTYMTAYERDTALKAVIALGENLGKVQPAKTVAKSG